MGRLFWKFFFVIWLAILAAGAGVASFAWSRWKAHMAELGLPALPPPRYLHMGHGAMGPRSPAAFFAHHTLGPVVPVTAAVIASLAASGLLAWTFSKPIRSLRWAFEAVGDGKLETRVMPRMGRRRDEMADLGRGFDRMTEQLELLVGAQRRLLHDVSHELRSPLARLQAAIGLARQDPRKAESSLDRIEREAGRLDGLVGELLALSHLEAGTADAPRQRVDLVELVASIADDARFEAHSLGRDVSFAGAGEIWTDAQAEPLHRAVENVLRNAVKFTADGTTVDVAVSRRGPAGPCVIRIEDRGPGVPERELPHIFEPFFRGESTNGGAVRGTGLGLAIARRAIEAHGGTITANNRQGGGLTMEVVLPLSSG